MAQTVDVGWPTKVRTKKSSTWSVAKKLAFDYLFDWTRQYSTYAAAANNTASLRGHPTTICRIYWQAFPHMACEEAGKLLI